MCDNEMHFVLFVTSFLYNFVKDVLSMNCDNINNNAAYFVVKNIIDGNVFFLSSIHSKPR